jgi:5-methylcytosine-specific restriction protein B
MEVEFTVKGQRYKASKRKVEAEMKGVTPDQTRALVVDVGGRVYPVKQVFSLVFDLDKADFISHQARSVLRRLGFNVHRLSAK